MAPLGRMAKIRHGMDRPERRRMVEALADFPRLLSRHPSRAADRGASCRDRSNNRRHGRAPCPRRDITTPGFEERRSVRSRDGSFSSASGRGDRPSCPGHHQLHGIGRLLEEERRLALRVGAHFPCVLRVIAADAVDASNRKHLVRADDRDRHRGHVEKRVFLLCGAAGPSVPRPVWPSRATAPAA